MMNKTTVGLNNDIHSARIYNSTLGNHNYIGPGVVANFVRMGNFCSVAPYCVIGGMEHDISALSTSTILYKGEFKGVEIADDVWIGAGVTIRTGTKIGRGAVVGAGSVVLHDIEPYEIVGGIPAKHIRYRFDGIKQNQHHSIDFSEDVNIVRRKLDLFNEIYNV